MGLDMYLTGKLYISKYDKETKPAREQLQKMFKTELEPEGVEFEIMYWRKANAIHRWFVEKVQDGDDDCGTYYVSNDQLRELFVQVTAALNSPNPEKLLPTQAGFFFGNTEYNEDYKEDLKSTKEVIGKFIDSPDAERFSVYYHSSW